MVQDKMLVCKECGKEFVFTAGEQEFYGEKGFRHQPQRCKACRRKKRSLQEEVKPRERKMWPGICAACGKNTLVPFEPRPEQLVYCKKCYAAILEERREHRR